MQTELDDETLDREVRILGINRAGSEAGNAQVCDGRNIPWLQDTLDQNVWGAWQVTWRDVIVLDEDNEIVAVFNLTQNSLSVPANYDSLKSILRDAATIE